MAFAKTAAFTFLRRAHEGGRLAHAYLISGSAGCGKRALAEELAALVLGIEPAAVLRHADVHLVEPESKSRSIVTDQMRALEKELQMRPTSGNKKVGIIFDADRMRIQASNAFLKTLEEPPSNSLLLLTTAQPETLPDTILSRCISVPLSRAGTPALTPMQAQLVEALREFFSPAAGRDLRARGIAASYRLVRRYTMLLQSAREGITAENAAEFKTEEVRYKQATDGVWLGEREDHFKAVTESRYLAQRSLLVETLVQWWADILRQQSGAATLDLPACAADTAALASVFTTTEALARIAHLETLRENLESNVKEDLATEVAFLGAFA